MFELEVYDPGNETWRKSILSTAGVKTEEEAIALLKKAKQEMPDLKYQIVKTETKRTVLQLKTVTIETLVEVK